MGLVLGGEAGGGCIFFIYLHSVAPTFLNTQIPSSGKIDDGAITLNKTSSCELFSQLTLGHSDRSKKYVMRMEYIRR